jgi:hypothetical protein
MERARRAQEPVYGPADSLRLEAGGDSNARSGVYPRDDGYRADPLPLEQVVWWNGCGRAA